MSAVRKLYIYIFPFDGNSNAKSCTEENHKHAYKLFMN